jgi:hypothetical protein
MYVNYTDRATRATPEDERGVTIGIENTINFALSVRE